MAVKTESNSYTVIFAIVMVVIVGALLAGISSALSGQISENKKLEKKQNILAPYEKRQGLEICWGDLNDKSTLKNM